MDQEIERYLNDHLAGSSGAVLVIDHLITTFEAPEAVVFFEDLKKAVEVDRALLEHLLASSQMQSSSIHQAAGKLAARVGFLKLMWEGLEPGKLGLFEALEMLALGVQGKRLLWSALGEISCWFPEWKDIDFAGLELEAIRQRDGVEEWRIEAARDVLASVERRSRSIQ